MSTIQDPHTTAITMDALEMTGAAITIKIDQTNNTSKNRRLLFKQLSFPHKFWQPTSQLILLVMSAQTQKDRESVMIMKISQSVEFSKNQDMMWHQNALTRLRLLTSMETEPLISMKWKHNMM